MRSDSKKTIDRRGRIYLTEAQVVPAIKAAYALSVPVGMGHLHARGGDLDQDTVDALLSRSTPKEGRIRWEWANMDYVHGRQCKFTILADAETGQPFIDASNGWYDHTDAQFAELLRLVFIDDLEFDAEGIIARKRAEAAEVMRDYEDSTIREAIRDYEDGTIREIVAVLDMIDRVGPVDFWSSAEGYKIYSGFKHAETLGLVMPCIDQDGKVLMTEEGLAMLDRIRSEGDTFDPVSVFGPELRKAGRGTHLAT